MKRGKFIVLEGIDGAGTTTHTALLRDSLLAMQVRSVVTREPSDGPIGTLIRQALRKRIQLSEVVGGGPLTPETIALLFAADRLDHVTNEIEPALERGIWVISDRYVHSSIAYQGRQMEPEWVDEINSHAMQPDLTIFINVPVEVALKRVEDTRLDKELFETREFLEQVTTGYEEYYADYGDKVVTIDGEAPIEKVAEMILVAVKRAFE
jgi:dTMP kinase